jgi:RNA recognition motif-containing protein
VLINYNYCFKINKIINKLTIVDYKNMSTFVVIIINKYEYFVGSLPFSIEEADLRESFEAYGAVDSVKIISINLQEEVKDLVLLRCQDEDAQKAIDELNGATVQGRAIVVNKSEPKPEGRKKKF